MSILSDALLLASLGFHVFPVTPNAKKPPLIDDFPNRATQEEEQIRQWWDKWPNANIGISTTQFGDNEALCVVDIDNKPELGRDGFDTFLKLEMEGKEFPPTWEATTPSRGHHLIYKTETPVNQGAANILGPGIDIRSKGGYILGAGSIIDGRKYSLKIGALFNAPKWILDICGAPRERDINANIPLPGIDPERALKRAVHYLENEAPLAFEGQGGDHTTFRVAARLKDFGLTDREALHAMLEHWNERCSPPWGEFDLDEKIQNAYHYGQEPIGVAAPEAMFDAISNPLFEALEAEKKDLHPFEKLNKEFAFVIAGGDSHILWETTDPSGKETLIHLGEEAFHKKFAADMLPMGDGKSRPVSKLWMNDPSRRSYDGICFMPKLNHPKRFYNLWRGFTVELPNHDSKLPSIAYESLAMFKDLILHSACQSNPQHAHWLTGFFAHIIQKPYEKPMVAPVFKGSKGVGKDSLLDTVGYLLGSHYMMTANRRYLAGNFNGHLENLLLFCLNEAFWSGDKQAEGILKDLITGKTHVIEHKGKSPYSIANLTRIVIIGNEEWLVPASEDERRYAVFEFSDRKKNQIEWFKKLHAGLKLGGYALLLKYLNEFNLEGIDLNTAPKTMGLLAQKVQSLDPFYQWWMECLQEGRVVDSDFAEGWPDLLDKKQFRDAFIRHCKSRQIKTRIPSEGNISKLFKKCLPDLEITRTRDGRNQVRCYTIPPLDICKLEFEKYIGQEIKW